VRAAAARTLARSGRPELIGAFGRVQKQASDLTLANVADAQLRLADAMIARGGNWNAAISVYERVLESSGDPARRGAALAGLGRYGDESSADVVMDAIAGKYGNDAVPPALSALATLQGRAAHARVIDRYSALPAPLRPAVLNVMGHTREAAYLALIERERQSQDETTRTAAEAAWQVATASNEPGSRFRPATDVPFLRNWHIAGPFPWKPDSGFADTHIGEPAIDLTARYGDIAWKKIDAGDDLVNLFGHLGNAEDATGYAFATIDAPEAGDAILWLGSDDGIKVWVNGEAVHENAVDRGVKADEDRIPLALRKGRNEVLLRITQHLGGWAFCARITGRDGSALDHRR
jgi:hypothetical protein